MKFVKSAALVLGLLIASANSTYDTQATELQQMSADVAQLDRMLVLYGPEAQQLAEWLVKKKYVEYLGSDMHHDKHLQMLDSSPKIFRMTRQLVESGLIRNAEL